MPFDHNDSGYVAGGLSLISILWNIATGMRRDKRETASERMEKERALDERIRSEAVIAVEKSQKFVLAVSQSLVNERLLAEARDTKEAVKNVDEKLSTVTNLLLAGQLHIKRKD
jgi:hypothetical protein